MRQRLLVAVLITLLAATFAVAKDEDPYLWLEEIEGEKALAWAKEKSAAAAAEFEKVPEFAELHAQLLEINTSPDRIHDARGVAWADPYKRQDTLARVSRQARPRGSSTTSSLLKKCGTGE